MSKRKSVTPVWRECEYGKYVKLGRGEHTPLYDSRGWVASLPDDAVDREPVYVGQKTAPFLCRVVRTGENWYLLTTRARALGGTRHRLFYTPEEAMEAGTKWVRRRFYHAASDEQAA